MNNASCPMDGNWSYLLNGHNTTEANGIEVRKHTCETFIKMSSANQTYLFERNNTSDATQYVSTDHSGTFIKWVPDYFDIGAWVITDDVSCSWVSFNHEICPPKEWIKCPHESQFDLMADTTNFEVQNSHSNFTTPEIIPNIMQLLPNGIHFHSGEYDYLITAEEIIQSKNYLTFNLGHYTRTDVLNKTFLFEHGDSHYCEGDKQRSTALHWECQDVDEPYILSFVEESQCTYSAQLVIQCSTSDYNKTSQMPTTARSTNATNGSTFALDVTNGVLESAHPYAESTVHQWLINPVCSTVSLSISIALESNYDFLKIGNETFTGSNLYFRTVPVPLSVEFTTDSSTEDWGFKITWSCVDKPNDPPPAVVEDPSSGIIDSNHPYFSDSNSEWVIDPQCANPDVFISFTSETEQNYDFLKIGNMSYSGNVTEHLFLPAPIIVSFTSDGSQEKWGFSLTWKCINTTDDYTGSTPMPEHIKYQRFGLNCFSKLVVYNSEQSHSRLGLTLFFM